MLAPTVERPTTRLRDNDQPAVLKIGIQGQYWIVKSCRWCKQRHVHGAGAHGEDPMGYLGHRSAHCLKNAPRHGYQLVLASSNEEEDGE